MASSDAINWTPSKLWDAHKANAKSEASHAAEAESVSRLRVKAKVTGGKAGRQKKQRSLAKGEKDVAEQPVHEGHDKSDDTSDGQEEVEEGEEEEEERETVVVDEDEHDTKEQDDDRHDRTSEEAEAEAADKAENEEVVVEADLAENARKKGE